MTRTALELIGQSGFGYSFDSLEEGAQDHPLSASIKNLLSVISLVGTARDPSVLTVIIRGCINNGPLLLARLLLLPLVFERGSPKLQRTVVDLLPWKALHEARDMVDIVHNTSVKILEATKQSLDGKDDPGRRLHRGKDIMSILGLCLPNFVSLALNSYGPL
jgi:hypothetical protein